MPFAAGLAQAILLFLAFHPLAWWPLALAAPIPLFLAARRPASWKSATAFAAGTIPFWLYHHLFIKDITGPGFIPLVLYLAAWPGLALWLTARARDRLPRLPLWAAAPFLLTGLDMLRGEVILTGYAWFLPGQPMIDSPLAPAGAAAGLYGVSLLTLGLAASLTHAATQRRPRALAPLAVWSAFAAAAVLLGRTPDDPAAPTRTIAIIQTNVPQSNKLAWTPDKAAADYARLLGLTLEADHARPDLILWPETMKFGWVLTDAQIAETQALLERRPELRGLADYITTGRMARDTSARVRAPILVGQETFEHLDFIARDGRVSMKYDARYNSAYLLHAGEVAADRYDKLEPTPFGENIPWASGWPWLRDRLTDLAAGGMRIDLASGTRRTVFQAGSLRAVTPICFESTDTALCRSLVYDGPVGGARRADLIACMTNDGWFGASTTGRRHHLDLARWRCVELGTPMARAANTGLSAAIDAHGRLLPTPPAPALTPADALPGPAVDRDGILLARVQTPTAPTLYGRVGNLAGWGSLAASIALFLGTVRRRGDTGLPAAPHTNHPAPSAGGPA